MAPGFTDRSILQPHDAEARRRPFTVSCKILDRKAKAILVGEVGTGVTAWLPLSKITVEESMTDATVTMPTWLAIEKGLNSWGSVAGQGALF